MKNPILIAIILIGSIVFSGCSSTPKTASMVDASVDFSQIRTYNFNDVLDTDGNQYQSLESAFLATAVSRELQSRGFTQSEQPDILVNFSIETQEKIRSRSTPSMGYGGGYDPYYDAYYDGWGATHQTRIDQYTEGKLNIDIIDPKARKLIWQGSTKGRLTQKDLENAEATLNEAVQEIFTQFPVANPASQTE